MSSSVLTVDRISFMLSLPDMARVDATLVPGKTYYRLATEDSLEDGELKSDGGSFNDFAADLLNTFSGGVEAPSDISPLKFSLFVNNRLAKPAVLNRHALLEFMQKLAEQHGEFDFAVDMVMR